VRAEAWSATSRPSKKKNMNKIENTLPIGFAGRHARACERGKEKVSSIKNMKRPNVLKKYTFGRFTLSKQLPK
jgi:hypothetical protein